jgi:hypothetical protein
VGLNVFTANSSDCTLRLPPQRFKSIYAWIAQHLPQATPYGQTRRFLIRDRDSKYGQAFGRAATASSIEILNTPYRAPKANAICERFLGDVRRECLDHVLILRGRHLCRVIKEYVRFFNQARPHQGIEQRIPEGIRSGEGEPGTGEAIAFPVLNGLHHNYQRAARMTASDLNKHVRGFWLAQHARHGLNPRNTMYRQRNLRGSLFRISNVLQTP